MRSKAEQLYTVSIVDLTARADLTISASSHQEALLRAAGLNGITEERMDDYDIIVARKKDHQDAE
jgi:hypothetical protein